MIGKHVDPRQLRPHVLPGARPPTFSTQAMRGPVLRERCGDRAGNKQSRAVAGVRLRVKEAVELDLALRRVDLQARQEHHALATL